MDQRASSLASPLAATRLEIRHQRGLSLVRRIWGPRTVGLGLGAVAVGAALLQVGAPAWLWPLVILNGLLWPHIAFWWASRSANPFEAEHRNLLIDSVSGGFWVVAMSFNLLPSVLILTMLSMDNIAVGGVRLFLRGLVAHLAGVMLAFIALDVRHQPTASLATIAACIPFLVVYPILIGVVTYRLSLKLSQQKQELKLAHERDPLSGLFSRAHWQQRLEEEFARASRHGRPSSLLLLDADHFKTINDTYGHACGDEAIRHLGHLIQVQVRHSDIAGRVGGEEFAVILPETDASHAMRLAERVRDALASSPLPFNAEQYLTVSIGIAELSSSIESSPQWLEQADQALYAAKRAGRNVVRLAA
ncbi:diguanylate cyclase [Uliginosibacterium sp. H1]|uniref:diguanylate cyclase n=1 Tax=Uliginosibacterium sp. H1 TaxID=3114757 RepID=UPI002E19CE2D|nr:diguanylate cyclase [Uliginosibacterium sp. H1]